MVLLHKGEYKHRFMQRSYIDVSTGKNLAATQEEGIETITCGKPEQVQTTQAEAVRPW